MSYCKVYTFDWFGYNSYHHGRGIEDDVSVFLVIIDLKNYVILNQ